MSIKSTLWERFKTSRTLDDCPIYDMHGHWGSFSGISMPASQFDIAKKLLLQSGVKRLVICHHHSLHSPDIGNAANIASVQQLPEILRAYMAINPNYPEVIEKDLAEYDSYPDVFVGFKMLSGYHRISVDDPRYQPVWEMANDRKLPVLLHTWKGCPYNGYEPVRKVLEKYPDAKTMLGHSLFDDWDIAAELGANFPNCYLELTAASQIRGAIETMMKTVTSEKIIYGTDFPWFNQPYCIGTILGADITDEDRRNILYRNAMRILGE
ncbi:MAG: amidohydrolase family protein [bacterium]